ncbi:MAG: YchE family NAAT transporter [Gammaproteobacteria bacterium]
MFWQDFLHFMVTLFALTNPIGNLAVFSSLTADKTPAEQRHTACITALSATIILIVTVWSGTSILAFFGISLPAFEIAGGLVLTLIGLSMLQAQTSAVHHTDAETEIEKNRDSVAIVPLAFPIIAGPGGITAVIIEAQNYPNTGALLSISLGIAVIGIFIGGFFSLAPLLKRLLGVTGSNIITRIMGLLLVAIAIEITIKGFHGFFPNLNIVTT